MVKNNKLWWFLVSSIYLVIAVLYGYDRIIAIKFAGNLTVLLLMFVLIPIRLKNWGINNKLITKLIAKRRAIGITAGFTVLAHVPLALFIYGGGDIAFLFRPEIISGWIAEGVIVVMLITSTAILTRKLGKNWKLVHRLVWVAVGAISVHSFTAAQTHTANNTSWIALSMVALLATTVLIDLLLKLKQGKSKVAIQTLSFLTLGVVIALVARALML